MGLGLGADARYMSEALSTLPVNTPAVTAAAASLAALVGSTFDRWIASRRRSELANFRHLLMSPRYMMSPLGNPYPLGSPAGAAAATSISEIPCVKSVNRAL